MDRKTDARSRRLRIARILDEPAMRALAAAIRPGSGARIELVLDGGARERIACGLRAAELRALLAAADGAGTQVELVLADNRGKT